MQCSFSINISRNKVEWVRKVNHFYGWLEPAEPGGNRPSNVSSTLCAPSLSRFASAPVHFVFPTFSLYHLMNDPEQLSLKRHLMALASTVSCLQQTDPSRFICHSEKKAAQTLSANCLLKYLFLQERRKDRV